VIIPKRSQIRVDVDLTNLTNLTTAEKCVFSVFLSVPQDDLQREVEKVPKPHAVHLRSMFPAKGSVSSNASQNIVRLFGENLLRVLRT
jgi:hypothetical protein